MSVLQVASTPSSKSQGKTKAKQRYLKRKKERRKHRPKVLGEQQDEGEITSKPVEDFEVDNEDDSTFQPDEISASRLHKTKRPKKRPRLEETDGDDHAMEIDNEDEKEPLSLLPPEKLLSPEVQAVLPSFPLPALPDAPSKADLALLGLDRALIGAEIVSPSTTLPIPTGEEDGGTGLSEKIRKRLRDVGVTELFAVQTALLPFLLPSEKSSNELYRPFNPPRDVCVSAPTGSGKTLAYVLPIIEILSDRVVTRLRALIVLPTRDLVTQVKETVEILTKGTNLKIGIATGQHSFAHEQSQLVQDQANALLGGSSKVDILICTPGRLIDHLDSTPNFSLQHLRFLVIDEADRLLSQSFQDWLARVLAAIRSPSDTLPITRDDESDLDAVYFSSLIPDGLSPTFLDGILRSHSPSLFIERKESPCQKLLFSATLAQDPGKLAALELRDPKYFIVQGSDEDRSESNLLDVVMEKFSMPSTLKEHMIVMDPSQKPLIFFYIVHKYNIRNALVFTKSAESTFRLVHLLNFFEIERTRHSDFAPLVVEAYSSDLPAQERRTILERFKKQEINMLICSDLISRGMDISHVAHVVSYDVPVDMRKYVHRVGRTARAGKAGEAWTLVEQQEARYFKQMMKDAGHFEKIKRVRINEKDLAPSREHYGIALNQLKGLYTRQV